MIAFLTLCYCGLVWLIFIKLKLLPWNRGSQFGVAAIGVTGIVALLVAMSLYQPYSTDVRVYHLVVEIVPRVTGRVIEVPVEGGTTVDKGTVLFRVDPRPFEYEIERLRAELVKARAGQAIAKAEYERNQRAGATGAVSQSDIDSAEARYREVTGSVGSLEAQLRQAEWELAETTVYAPSRGVVTNLTLVPGQVASKMAGQPVMTFVSDEGHAIVATYPPNALRHVAVGDAVEIAFDRHPGEILNARVVTLVDISAQGQLAPGGDVPDWTDASPTSRFPILFEMDTDASRFELPGGAGGAAAIYTEAGKPIRIVRRVVVRMYTWLNYFF